MYVLIDKYDIFMKLLNISLYFSRSWVIFALKTFDCTTGPLKYTDCWTLARMHHYPQINFISHETSFQALVWRKKEVRFNIRNIRWPDLICAQQEILWFCNAYLIPSYLRYLKRRRGTSKNVQGDFFDCVSGTWVLQSLILD